MARTFGAVHTSIWSDPDFRALPAGAQRLYILMFSWPLTTLAGTLPLQVRRWARTAPDVTADDVRQWLDVLVAERFVLVDEDTEEVLIRSFMAHDKGYKIPNVAKSIITHIGRIESDRLRTTALTAFSAFDCVKHLLTHTKQPLPEPLPEGLDEQIPQGTGSGSGSGSGSAHPKNDDRFADFWDAYPRKTDRKRALTAWRNLTANDRTAALAAIPRHVANWEARRTAQQHIPHPTTWLHGRRWEDELPDATPRTNRTVTIGGAQIAETAW